MSESLTQGDEIRLLRFADENWGVGKLNGKQGIFPICFTEPISPPPKPKKQQNSLVNAAKQTLAPGQNKINPNDGISHEKVENPEGPVPYGFGIVIDDTNLEIELGDKVVVLGESYQVRCSICV